MPTSGEQAAHELSTVRCPDLVWALHLMRELRRVDRGSAVANSGIAKDVLIEFADHAIARASRHDARGLGSEEVAMRLGISSQTVRNVILRLGRAGLVGSAGRAGKAHLHLLMPQGHALLERYADAARMAAGDLGSLR